MVYYLFTEHNDWEGENYYTFIPVEGNENVCNRINDIIDRDDWELYYEMDLSLVEEDVVDTLVSKSEAYEKIEGVIDEEKLFSEIEKNGGDLHLVFYKGDIIKWVK